MSEYTKLTSDDNNTSYSAKFLSENIPFGKKIFRDKIKKENKQSEIELFDFKYKNNISNLYSKNKINNSSGYGYSRSSQEKITYNNARKGNMKMFLYNKNNEPLIVLGPDSFSSFIVIIFFVFFLYLRKFFYQMEYSLIKIWMNMKN